MASGGQQPNNGLISGINVTPLVDITLVLLIIFLVTAKLIVTPVVPVDLPRASQSRELQVVFAVVVPVSGPITIDGRPISSDDELVAMARRELRDHADLRAVIHADGNVPHRRVIHMLDLLRGAGVDKVAFGALADDGEEDRPH